MQYKYTILRSHEESRVCREGAGDHTVSDQTRGPTGKLSIS